MFLVLKLVAYLATVSPISDNFAECLTHSYPTLPSKETTHTHVYTFKFYSINIVHTTYKLTTYTNVNILLHSLVEHAQRRRVAQP